MKYTIEEKIKAVNEELGTENENIPAVSLSVGVAFSDRENPRERMIAIIFIVVEFRLK